MILKLDLEKAFDRLEWSFIYCTLNYFSFPSKFSNLLLNCITSSSIVAWLMALPQNILNQVMVLGKVILYQRTPLYYVWKCSLDLLVTKLISTNGILLLQKNMPRFFTPFLCGRPHLNGQS